LYCLLLAAPLSSCIKDIDVILGEGDAPYRPSQEVLARATRVRENLRLSTVPQATATIDVNLPREVPEWLSDFGKVNRENAPTAVSYSAKVKVRVSS
jgi:hypothetical protein